jgi:hypothetical protein
MEAHMEIVKLPVGVPARVEDDCIRIQQLPDGQYLLTGTLLAPSDEEGSADSVGLVESEPYPSYEAAEAAGLAWANECGVEVLHVSSSDGTEPLPEAR